MLPQALAVVRRGQQPIDHFLVGIRRIVLEEASSSSGVGGRPVRSNVTRRSRGSLSARGDGVRPAASSRARIKASMGLTHQLLSWDVRRVRARCGGVQKNGDDPSANCRRCAQADEEGQNPLAIHGKRISPGRVGSKLRTPQWIVSHRERGSKENLQDSRQITLDTTARLAILRRFWSDTLISTPFPRSGKEGQVWRMSLWLAAVAVCLGVGSSARRAESSV